MSDLFIAAIILKHPDQPEDRLVAEYELADKITDASSAILKRVQVDGWEAFRITTRKIEDVLSRSAAADFIGTTIVTFRRVCDEYRIEPAHTTANGVKLYRKSDLEPYVVQEK